MPSTRFFYLYFYTKPGEPNSSLYVSDICESQIRMAVLYTQHAELYRPYPPATMQYCRSYVVRLELGISYGAELRLRHTD